MSTSRARQLVNQNNVHVEAVIPPAILKLRDKFQALGYRTTFQEYYVDRLNGPVIDAAYLHDMSAVYHVHGGTIVFEPRVEGISAAFLYHPLSAQPIIMHLYTDTGEFCGERVCGMLEGVEYIAASSFEDVFADYPADAALWGEEEKQKELLAVRRPKSKFILVEKPLSREEIMAKREASKGFAEVPEVEWAHEPIQVGSATKEE